MFQVRKEVSAILNRFTFSFSYPSLFCLKMEMLPKKMRTWVMLHCISSKNLQDHDGFSLKIKVGDVDLKLKFNLFIS